MLAYDMITQLQLYNGRFRYNNTYEIKVLCSVYVCQPNE